MRDRRHNVLVVIPARGGSKGVPDKNLRLIGDRTLVHHSVSCAMKAKTVDRVVVSTDDERIANEAKKAGAEVPFLRPPELSTDSISLIPVIIHAAKYLDEAESWKADIVASIQPTSPFLEPLAIDKAVEILLKSNADSVATVKKIEHGHPFWVKKLIDGRVHPFSDATNESYLQRQDLPPAYIYDGALFVRKRYLLDNWAGKDFCLGKDIRAVVSSDVASMHIDDMIDLEAARGVHRLLQEQKQHSPFTDLLASRSQS